MSETFIPRHELIPHLDRAGVVWTNGGKLSFGGERVGHLSNWEGNGITVSRGKPCLDGSLIMFEGTGYLEDDVREAFRLAFEAVLRERSVIEESRKRESADISVTSKLGKALRELKYVISGVLDQIASVMAGGGEVQKDHSQEGKN